MGINLTKRNMLIGLLAVLSGLILLRAVRTVFVYPLLLVLLAVFVFAPLKVCLPTLCFLMPFANIIKLQPGQISLFTVMFLIYVIRTLFKKNSLRRIFLISLLFFAAYSFVFSGIEKIITIATMVCGFAMLHDACRSDEYDYKEVLYAFCAGIIISAVLGLMKDYFPIIASFVKEATQKVGQGEYVERFSGLCGNPNYYTMDISVALSCLTVMISKSKPQKLQVLLFAILSVLGILSVSKSFLLVWIVLLLLLMFYGFRNGGTAFLKLASMFVLTGIFIYFFAKESVDTYIFRLTQDSGGSLSGLTTGRTDIWMNYLKEIIKSEKVLLFGNGLGNMLHHAPHNTYLEGLYYVGVVGMVFYGFVLKMSIPLKEFPRKFVFYLPVIVLLIRFMGIGVFINDCLWYYLVVIILSLKYEARTEKHSVQGNATNN